jgi:uncharacterized damage-inducible protein DinB
MSSQKNFNKLIEVITRYAYKLNNYTEESFVEKKHEDVWSAAEVYAHITSANRLSIRGMHKAMLGEATEDSNPLSWQARIIFFLGRIPRGRKAPELLVKRTPKLNSIAEAKNALDDLESELNEIWDSRFKWSKTQKMRHPALGYLNNDQWISFMIVHSNHHLKQLARIRQH